ncbi:phenylalanine racemase [Planococcus sp. A6]|nr:phenylalanine racemase [Planococcus sp. A6]MDE0582243.1 phenylalanine racemase [Planococcus sp. A6]
MSRAEFDGLTEVEKLFISKEYENKFIHDTTWMRNAVLNAEANVNRGKNKPFKELFPKKQTKADKEYNQNAEKTIERIEKKNGKGWVARILERNGITTPSKKGGKK